MTPRRETLRADALAGLPGAIGSVPDGMAASVLTGVDPIHGLSASFAGPSHHHERVGTGRWICARERRRSRSPRRAVPPDDDRRAVMIDAGVLRRGRLTASSATR